MTIRLATYDDIPAFLPAPEPTAADGKNYLTQFYKLEAIISAEQAKEFAETEFEKYRIIQDRLFESDFDKFTLPTLPFDEQE